MISFKKINKNNQDDIKKLFFLIKSRKYNISNTQNPNYEEHKKFVLNHPYREWLFINQKEAHAEQKRLSSEINLFLDKMFIYFLNEIKIQ